MSALDRLASLPSWPARMTAPVAAAYMGVSPNTFRTRFGAYSRREGANVLWARAQLDLLIAEQFGFDPVAPAAPAMDNAYDAWKAGRVSREGK